MRGKASRLVESMKGVPYNFGPEALVMVVVTTKNMSGQSLKNLKNKV